MRIKVVQLNENGKIELTVKELQDLLNESYHQGWNDKPYNYYGTYTTATNSGTNSNIALLNNNDDTISLTYASTEGVDRNENA